MILTPLLLASLAAATPLTARDQKEGNFPPTSRSTAFRLVVSVVDADFDPPINDAEVYSYRIGANQFVPSVSNTTGDTFWEEWTPNDAPPHTDPPRKIHSTYSDASLMHKVWTAVYPDEDGNEGGDAKAGPSSEKYQTGVALPVGEFSRETVGFEVAFEWWGWAQFWPSLGSASVGTFIACKTFAAPNHPEIALSITEMYAHEEGVGSVYDVVPEGCIPINLFVQCAEMPPLPEQALYTHEDAMELWCYEDAKGIDWSKYDYPGVNYTM